MVFNSESDYISRAQGLRERLDRIDSIIDALLLQSVSAAANSDISEYQLDDGQTKIRTMYRDSAQVASAIAGYERLKQMYLNRLQGRVTRLMDGKNFN